MMIILSAFLFSTMSWAQEPVPVPVAEVATSTVPAMHAPQASLDAAQHSGAAAPATHAPQASPDTAQHSGAAAPAKDSSVKTWFKHWRLALQKSVVEGRYRKMKATSVAAVRGASQAEEDPTKPYWKGSWSEKRAAERMAERKELEAAVSLILDGKTEEAERAFSAFEQTHPRSSFLQDIKDARAQIAAMKAESVKPQAETKP
ncbi:MAG: hypothetical protein WC728_14750 [Elusimicrobiota bacterium]